jgi:Protein of unknown function (DUF5672)
MREEMLKLPNVSLVCVETRQHELARFAIQDCLDQAEFGDVIIFTDQPRHFTNMSVETRFISVPDWPNKQGWSRCFWYDVPLYMRTSHALCIQWDSWIADPSMWREEFLQYDYVGAPWWYKDGMNVGNGGFCLRSTKFMRFIRKHRAQFPCITDLDDDLYCRQYRPTLQEAGFIWAPEDVAIDFAFECVRSHERTRHFGFHAAYNFDYGCGFDQERIMQRARIMAKSKHMTVTHPYFWDGFVKSNGWVVDRLRQEQEQQEPAVGRDSG